LEIIANAIHERRLRAKKPFIKVNCAALPKELIESELFGHVKGAFTGAQSEKKGLIGAADGGSLLLDEIAEMPIELQPKLLRVLQERQYHRLGSETPIKVDFRLISATNREPHDAIREGVLREDLYYRISTITIDIPPLRDRAEDVPLIAEHFLNRFAERYNKEIAGFSRDAYEKLLAYSWPGNVRELENVIERAVLLSRSSQIEAAALPFAGDVSGASSSVAAAQTMAAAAAAQAASTSVPPGASAEGPSDGAEPIDRRDEVASSDESPNAFMVPVGMTLEEIERSVIYQTLKRTKGYKQAAANALGIYRPRLYSKIKKYNMTEFM
jgi:transcriptional regulator with PAS, ATPase and Fis domain